MKYWFDIKSQKHGSIMIHQTNDEMALEEAAVRWGTTYEALVAEGVVAKLADAESRV